jgi:hypothetical protein
MNRNAFPSTRINPTMGCAAPVQCFVSESVKLSVADHTLKYGSCTISGVEGGRNCAAARGAAAKPNTRKAITRANRLICNFLNLRLQPSSL